MTDSNIHLEWAQVLRDAAAKYGNLLIPELIASTIALHKAAARGVSIQPEQWISARRGIVEARRSAPADTKLSGLHEVEDLMIASASKHRATGLQGAQESLTQCPRCGQELPS